MRIGIGHGIGVPSSANRTIGIGAPLILRQADLWLDSRLGVSTDGATEVDLWANQGRANSDLDFANAGGDRLIFLASDPATNAKPSLENVDDAGNVTDSDLTQLNYLHNGSAFTLFAVVSELVNNGANQIIFANTGTTTELGTQLAFAANGNLQFLLYNEGGTALLQLVTDWPDDGDTHVIAVQYTGTDYVLYIDGEVVNTQADPTGQLGDDRILSYAVGGLNAGSAMAGKVTHISAWDIDIGDDQIESITAYLQRTFVSGVPNVYLDASLVLDTRFGVTFDPENNDDVQAWLNQGIGLPAEFSKGVGPFMRYFVSSGFLAFQPSITQNADDGFLATTGANKELDYLHLDAPFTLIYVGNNFIPGSAEDRTIIGCPAAGAGAGIHFYIDAADTLHFEVFDDAGVSIVDLQQADALGPHVYTVQYTGSEYILYHDASVSDTDAGPFTHGTNPHEGEYAVGNLPAGGAALDGRLAQVATWERDIGVDAIQVVSDYLSALFVLEFQVLLDTRLGVLPEGIQDGEESTGWINLGSEDVDFESTAFNGPIYIDPDPRANNEPSLRFSRADEASLQDDDATFTTLNYLHDGTPFTFFGVYVGGQVQNDLQTLISNLRTPSGTLGEPGFQLRVGNQQFLSMRIANGNGQFVLNRNINITGEGLKIFVVRFDGAEYTVFLDGISYGSTAPNNPIEPGPRTTPYIVGNELANGQPLRGRMVFLGTTLDVLSDEQIATSSALLRNVFG